MTTYSITISDDYVTPTAQIETNAEYISFVMNTAAKSYAGQYNAATFDEGVTAAREAFNASLPQTVEVNDAA